MRIAIVQRVIKGYRLPVYRELSRDHEVRFIYGEDIPGTKTKSCAVKGVNCRQCRTTHFRVGERVVTIHWNLIAKLREFNPDCILAEGESHFVGCFQTFLYRLIYKPKVGVMKWCFIDLPGEERVGLRFYAKFIIQHIFDAFVLYSSASKKALNRYKVDQRRGFVTVNVADVEGLLDVYEKKYDEKHCARHALGVPNLFTVLFIGNFERQKRFERYLDVAELCKDREIQFLVAGGGENLEHFKDVAKQRSLNRVTFLGHLSAPSRAYFASDIVYIPGRGGMVISEAFCFALPVLVHHADGTESDLIDGQGTGYILEDNANAVGSLLAELVRRPDYVKEMGMRGQALVRNHYNTKNMAKQIVAAGRFSIGFRS